MRINEILDKLDAIEDIAITEAIDGFGNENRISIEINNPQNILKWEYFHERLREEIPAIKISRHYPKVRWVFPLYESDLQEVLEKFSQFLDRKFYMLEKPPKESVTIIAKVTNLCNLDCQYCYDKPFRESLGHNGIIDIEKIEKTIRLASYHAREVVIIWHGGEPTLAGLDFYKKIHEEILPKYPWADYDIGFQTNGTLLNKDWYEFAKKHGLEIGSSYNATQEDLRHTLSENELGSKSHNIYSVLHNIEEASKYDVSIGVIDVLTKENHQNIFEIYDFYKNVGVDACFNEIHKAGEATKHDLLFLTPEEIKEYEKRTAEYFAYWIKDQDSRHFIDRYASQYIQILFMGTGGVCNYSGRCIYNWLGINSNGDLYPCDRPLPPKYRIGNIIEFDSMMDIFSSDVYQNFAEERAIKLATYCSKCDLRNYCHGGCPMKDIDESGTAMLPNRYACSITRANLKSAYKALLHTSFEECNRSMQRFLLANTFILPGEIPKLMQMIGLADEFPTLHYDDHHLSFTGIEFSLFQAVNPPEEELYLWQDIPYEERCLSEYHGEIENDDRLQRAAELLKEKAEQISCQISAERERG